MKKALTVLAALSIVLAVTGGAFAAKGLLTGADIKNGSLTGVDIASHSVGAGVFTASARQSFAGSGPRGRTGIQGVAGVAGLVGANGAAGLAGAKGAAGSNGSNGSNGANGATGATGAAGAAGANGTVTPLSMTAGSTTILTGVTATVVSMIVPAGRYTVLAKTQVSQTGAGDSVTCALESTATTIDSSSTKTGPANFATTLPLQAIVTTVGPTTTLSVQCNVLTAGGSANNSSIIAIPTS
jgi:collagen triple helix repeat protein